MYITINSATEFMDEFTRMGRGEQYSYEALPALFDYYDELEYFELHVIADCCEWKEYESEEDALEYYGSEDIDELQYNHAIIELDNGHVLVQE